MNQDSLDPSLSMLVPFNDYLGLYMASLDGASIPIFSITGVAKHRFLNWKRTLLRFISRYIMSNPTL